MATALLSTFMAATTAVNTEADLLGCTTRIPATAALTDSNIECQVRPTVTADIHQVPDMGTADVRTTTADLRA